MKDVTLILISESKEQDATGVWRKTETSKEVFAKVDSIYSREFFDAGRNGLNPEYRFMVFAGDYSGEEECLYLNKMYSIYRTYENGDYMELYVERKGGSNGEGDN